MIKTIPDCGPRLQTAPTFVRVLTCATLLAVLMSGCGSATDSFAVHYDSLSWSPDGKSIAFGASGDLYVAHLRGRTTRETHLAGQEVREPIWSPDGTKIAYDVCEESEVNPYCFVSHTVVRDVESGRSITLTQDSHPFGSCHIWSPDGKRIALLVTRGDSAAVSVVNRDGSGLERLAKADDSATSCLAWSPHGRLIAYACCGTGSDVHLVDSDGHNKRRLTYGMYATDVTWSPGGELIAFHHLSEHGQDGYLSMRPDGAARTSIAPDETGYADGLVWSPDSRRIAYVNDGELFVADRDGGNRHLVAHGVSSPRWSPNRERLAVVKDDPEGEAAIYVIDADGKRPAKVSSPPETGDN